jgi:CRP-like cAMP-binding protein
MRSLLEAYRVAFATPWHAEISDLARSELMARTRRRVLAAGDRLFSTEESPDGMYRVVEGSIWNSGLTADGRETLLDLYGPGDWFGETASLAGTTRMLHIAEAYGNAVVDHLNSIDLEHLIATHPSFSRGLLRLQARRLQILLAALQQYSLQPIEERLATRLLMLAGKFGVPTAQGLRLDLHLPQETLAKMVGSTRQRVNQILHDWELANLLMQQYGRIILLDPVKLEKILT